MPILADRKEKADAGRGEALWGLLHPLNPLAGVEFDFDDEDQLD